MGRPYLRKKHVTISLYDGTSTTPYTESITGYADVPELPEPVVDAPAEGYSPQGVFNSIEEGDDTITLPEFSITLDINDADVASGKYALDQWFNNHKESSGATALVSTNDGSAYLKKAIDGTTVSANLATDWFTIGMKVIFDTGGTGKAFGKNYKYVRPISASFSTSNKAQVTLRAQIVGAPTDITSSS
jgi:hypothetical protein